MVNFVPHTDQDRRKMLASLDCDSVEELFSDIPEEVRLRRELELPEGMSEPQLRKHMRQLSEANETLEDFTCFLGAGVYDHYIPSVVDHIISRGEFYTAYTPYQAEISQGTLQSIYEYQTMIGQLTGLGVANASMYDAASAVAEAALMAQSVFRGRKNHVLVSGSLHPEYIETLRTYGAGVELDIEEVPFNEEGTTDADELSSLLREDTCCAIVQHPNFFGCLEQVDTMASLLADSDALFIVVHEPIALAVLEAPGNYGADIAVGEGQALGNPPSFGGPHLGYFAARQRYIRQMPGRIVGATVDVDGDRGFVMTLQTREQHIRRERATSNICSNEALNALAATVYLTYMGKEGLRKVALDSTRKAHYAFERITEIEGFEPVFERPFFKEFVVKTPLPAAEIVEAMRERGVLAGVDLGRFFPDRRDNLMISVTEKRTRSEIDDLVEGLEVVS